MWFYFLFYLRIFILKDYQSFLHVFLKVTQKILKSWIFVTKYDPSGNSNLSFHAEADILNLLFLYVSFVFFHVY